MKGKILTNITKTDYVYIDGATGEELTQNEFQKRYNKKFKILGKTILGENNIPLETGEREERKEETQ